MKLELPNYFLADLPPEATLNPGMITEACRTLARNREQYLLHRSTRSLVEVISGVAAEWLDPSYPFRRAALAAGPEATGFSEATLASGLDHFFRQCSPENLNALLAQELGHAQRLDVFSTGPGEEPARRSSRAAGPGLLVQLAAGNLPPPTLTSMVLGLLVRSAQFIKCSSRATLLPRLFAHSLYEADAKLGACLELAAWRGGHHELEAALFEAAECVTATGSDETLASVRSRLPARVRFLGYGHRVSFGLVTRDVVSSFQLKRAVAAAAQDVIAWDQQGCLSPHVIYVEDEGTARAEQFAALLAAELARLETTHPRAPITVEEAAAIAARRNVYAVRAAHLPDTRHWASENSTAWTVIFEAEPAFQLSCLNRFVYVKPIPDVARLLHATGMVQGRVSTVGIAAAPESAERLVSELARWGVTRVCPLGLMQQPPLTWRHDGRPALGDLVTWTDWER